MTTKHTPGPWILDGLNIRIGPPSQLSGFSLATVGGGIELPEAETKANAALIARAPEIPELEAKVERVKKLLDRTEEEWTATAVEIDRIKKVNARFESQVEQLRGAVLEAMNDMNMIAGNLVDRENIRERLRTALKESETKP